MRVTILIDSATVTVFVDGGVSRLSAINSLLSGPSKYQERFVVGDLDSATVDDLDMASRSGVDVVHCRDQNSTDLDKAFIFVKARFPEVCRQSPSVYILGDIVSVDGRFDHTVAALGTIKRECAIFGHIYVLGGYATHILIPAGSTCVPLPTQLVGSTCGVLPVFGKCGSVTTSGLKWNLSNSELEIGGLVSSSNVIDSDQIKITSDRELLFTICSRLV